jgi:hypothetical protein
MRDKSFNAERLSAFSPSIFQWPGDGATYGLEMETTIDLDAIATSTSSLGAFTFSLELYQCQMTDFRAGKNQ